MTAPRPGATGPGAHVAALLFDIDGTLVDTPAGMTRVLRAVVAVCVVLIPLRVTDFSMSALWPVIMTVAILAVAALLTRLGRPVQPTPPLR